MATITVDQFKAWSQHDGAYVLSKSKAPKAVIERVKGEIIPGTEQVVDEAELDGNSFLRLNP